MEEGNPCCSELKKGLLKLEEKRNALRQAVKLLEHQLDKVQAENEKLKEASKQEKLKMELEKEARQSELSKQKELEKEISSLKMEVSSLREDQHFKHTDSSQNQLLETRVFEGETEIKKLKLLLDKEKKKWESERRKAEQEKKKATEAYNLVDIEKSKADKERKLCEIERKRVEEYRLELEKSNLETTKAREALMEEKCNTRNASRKAESESLLVLKEKKRANKERAKAEEAREHLEEARKNLEEERKNAVVEEEHVNHLVEQLESERRKRDDLQKEMDRKVWTDSRKVCVCLKDNTCPDRTSIENDNIQLLIEKLKLEKKQVKHGKKMSKLQEAENNLLRRELNLLKQEFVCFSHNLNMLGDNLSQKIKGIGGLTKFSQNMDFNWNKEFDGLTIHDRSYPSKKEVTRTNCPTNEIFDHPEQYATHKSRCYVSQEVGGDFSCPTSGINSALESPVRDSVRRKSQSPVTYSTTASFSDRSFMGSQERSPPDVTTTTKFAEKNLKCRGVEIRQDKSPYLLEGKNGHNNAIEKVPMSWQSNSLNEKRILESNHRTKRRKIEGILESLACLHAEDENLQTRIKEEFGILDGLFLRKNGLSTLHSRKLTKHLNNGNDFSEISTEFDKKKCQLIKRKESKKQNSTIHILDQRSNQGTNLQNLENVGCNLQTQKAHSTHQNSKEARILIEDEAVELCSNQKNEWSLPHLNNMSPGKLMKLLELDNVADEERYQLAMARPLSPTLPVLKPREFPTVEVDYSDLNENISKKGKEIDNGKNTGCKMPGFNEFPDSANRELNSKHNEDLNTCTMKDKFSEKRTSFHLVTFSNFKAEDSIFRILHVLNAFYSFAGNNDDITNDLSAFPIFEGLQADEKTIVVLSILLDHFHGQISSEIESFSLENASHFKTISETKTQFQEICNIDDLLKLIEDFLMHRQIFSYVVPKDQSIQGNSCGANYFMGEGIGNVNMSSKVASFDQLAAGIIILASLCKMFDRVHFLWEVSYKILRTFFNDANWVLSMIHGFAHVCGERFFTGIENSMLATTVKSIILVLEQRLVSSEFTPLTTMKFLTFSPCKDCSFNQGAISLDKLVHILLSKIEETLSSRTTMPSKKRPYECLYETVGKTLQNSEPCLHEDTDESWIVSDKLCCFVDVISLLELAACYTVWEWTYKNVLGRLLVILQSCSVGEYSSVLLVSIGKLGRIGVDAEGYGHRDVAELRERVSTFLNLRDPQNINLLVQSAAVGAILDLTPLSFDQVVGDGYHAVIDERSCSHIQSVRNWFRLLNDEQKMLISNLFR